MTGKHLSFETTRDVRAADICWPEQEELRSENVGMNHSYYPLPRCTWKDVRSYIEEERALLRESASQPNEEDEDEWDENEWDETLLGLELGTNALVAALRASKCFPFYSCNGGVLGGRHNDWHPVVAFYCRPAILPFVLAAAEASDCGLQYNHAGGITAYSPVIDRFLDMAEQLYEMRTTIRTTRVRAPRVPGAFVPARQLSLF